MRRRSNHSYAMPTQTLASRTINSGGFYNENTVYIDPELNLNTSNIIAGEVLTLPSSNIGFSLVEKFSCMRINIDNLESGNDYVNLNVYQTNDISNDPTYTTRTQIKGQSNYMQIIPIDSKFLKIEVENPNTTDTANISVYSALTKYTQFEASNQLQNTVKPFDTSTLIRLGNDLNNDIVMNNYEGIEKINIVADISTTTGAATRLFTRPNPVYTILNTSDTVSISSSATTDANKSIHIIGIDTNGDILEEDILLDATDGTTPITTLNQYKRINTVYMNDEPLNPINTVNNGTISFNTSTGGFYMASMPSGYNKNATAKYAVPRGKILVLKKFNIVASSGTKDLIIRFNKYSNISGGINTIEKIIRWTDAGGIQLGADLDLLLTEMQEFYITVSTSTVSTGVIFMSLNIDAYQYDDTTNYRY